MTHSIYDAFTETARRYPQRTAVQHKVNGKYVRITFSRLVELVNTVASNLHNLGIEPGDVIGLFASNRPEWMLADLAAMKLGAIVVPVYPTTPPAALKYLIRDSQMRLIVVENSSMLSVVESIMSDETALRAVILIENGPSNAGVVPFSEMMVPRPNLRPLSAVVCQEDVATIVYTSGTTGEPKGVVLTHGNILTNVRAVVERFGVTCNDSTLSYLPLCHMFERTCGYYALLLSGGSVAYAQNLSTVLDDVRQIKPTVMIAVPRVLEKAYETVLARVQNGSVIMRQLVKAAIAALNVRTDIQFRNRPVPLGLRLRSALFDRLIAARFRAVCGRQLRIIACGGAPFDRKLAKLYHVLGFHVIEGYGLTEASPVVSCNSASENRLGTVGKPLPGVEVIIGAGDEILVRGPNIMQGYLNKPEETARAVDSLGWLHTGDQGKIDAHGHLMITGRLKDLIVTSCGKKVAVSAIESLLQRSPYISQAAVFGDNRKYLTALFVPCRTALESLATNISRQLDYAELLHHPDIRRVINDEVERLSSDLPPHEHIRAFALVAKEFNTEDELMTPTLKLRRQAIESHYRELVDNLYETGKECHDA